jgi:hypothetical protein
MLPTAKVLEIRRLLDQRRLSQRQIANRLAVSRGVVHAIANGLRGLHGRDPDEVEASFSTGPNDLAERCPGCGGMVYQPCRLCEARAAQRRARLVEGVLYGLPGPQQCTAKLNR